MLLPEYDEAYYRRLNREEACADLLCELVDDSKISLETAAAKVHWPLQKFQAHFNYWKEQNEGKPYP